MKRVILFLFAAIAVAACTESTFDIEFPNSDAKVEVPTLTAGFECNDTRIHLNDVAKTTWDKDDLLSVFYKSTTRQQWQFQGDTGDISGEIKLVDDKLVSGKGKTIVAVYPDNANYTYNMSMGLLAASTPSVQSYTAGSYGQDGNILVSCTTNENVKLKNVYGWLRIELTGSTTIRSIKLVGNKSEQLYGDISINVTEATASFSSADSSKSSITLDCGYGVALNSRSATTFYIGLLPQTFDSGFAIEIEDVNGAKMTKTTNKRVVIERNTIQPMRAFEYVPEVDYSDIESKFPANNQIWYDRLSANPYSFYSNPCNATILTNKFGACNNNQCYSLFCLTFNKEVSMIYSWGFGSTDFTAMYIPHSVSIIEKCAFKSSAQLKELHLGSGIESIDSEAFADCTSLEGLYIRATTPPYMASDALINTSTGAYLGNKIYVPESVVSDYKVNKSWMKYADYIRGYDFIKGKEVGDGSGDGGDVVVVETPYNHRVLILDHTGSWCGYCPIAADDLHALANSSYASCYSEVTVHGSGSYDPAYSQAAYIVDEFYDPSGYPYLYLNFYGGNISHSSSISSFVNTTMAGIFASCRKESGADVGIAIKTQKQNSSLYIDIDVKSAKKQKYYVNAWVLENNIWSPNQANATSDIHKTYNHALRYIAGRYSTTYLAGDLLGELDVDMVGEKSYTVSIDSGWNANNLEVLVIVSAPIGNDKYEVVNTAVCPINSTKDYEYR